MCRLKITAYISMSVHSRSVGRWIILIMYQAEVTRRYGLHLILAEIIVNVLVTKKCLPESFY